MAKSDFNGDGRDDILWRHDSGLVTNWLGTADGSFVNNHVNSATFVPDDWFIAGVGDFNGDGISDVLWRHYVSGLVTNWLGTANGSFVNNHALSQATVPTDWQIAGVGDFNGDSLSDVLWRHDGGLVTNWLGTANGSFVNNHANSAVLVQTDWLLTGVGDFNGDGNSDIVWQNDRGSITRWLATDDGGYTRNNTIELDQWAVGIEAIGDFNGDGRDDLFIVDQTGFGVTSSYLARPDGSFDFSGYEPFGGALGRFVVSAGDFNGDGVDDILWRIGDSLTSSLGVESEGNFTENPNFAASVPTTWQVQSESATIGWWAY